MKKSKGITLIALVVTIVVLLILAGVSISMLTGENGIIKQAQKSKEETVIAEEKEQVELAYVNAAIKKLGEDVEESNLQEELDSAVGNGKTDVSSNEDGTLNVLFNETQNNYNVDKGVVSKAPTIIYFSFYDSHGNFRETLYAYEGQTWKEWQDSGLAGKQGAGIFTNFEYCAGSDNVFAPDVGFFYDQECTVQIPIKDVIQNGRNYYAR